MRFGICTSIENSAAVKAAGWDFVEENAQSFLQGNVADGQWHGLDRAKASPLPVLAVNCIIPGAMKMTGPAVDWEKLANYTQTMLSRAEKAGVKTVAFGSAGSRNVPDGFDREKARGQIVDFLRWAGPIAGRHGITIAAEPLDHRESNILNRVGEVMQCVKAVNHPNVMCLVDSYHFWIENDRLEDLKPAAPWIRHVHVADKDGRLPPGDSKTADYRPIFRVLKDGGYDGSISVESPAFKDMDVQARRVLGYLKRQWQEC
jgi:sugar phosphate isomerase/epimerase